jgi:methyl-accepting chemotaxis protein
LDAEVLEPARVEPEPALAPPPKNRAELIGELQKNYTEVLGIVRKVDQHLDDQQGRADRMLSIAERSAERLEVLPELVEQNRRVADAILQLVEVSRQGQSESKSVTDRISKTATQQLEATQQQTTVLYNVQTAMHSVGEAEKELAGSVNEFRGSMGAMSQATSDLGQSISTMRETDAAREEELARLVRSGQRWLVVAVIVTGLLAAGTLVVVINGGI